MICPFGILHVQNVVAISEVLNRKADEEVCVHNVYYYTVNEYTGNMYQLSKVICSLRYAQF